jgi:hypothetical protein
MQTSFEQPGFIWRIFAIFLNICNSAKAAARSWTRAFFMRIYESNPQVVVLCGIFISFFWLIRGQPLRKGGMFYDKKEKHSRDIKVDPRLLDDQSADQGPGK